jgi:dihydroorotase
MKKILLKGARVIDPHASIDHTSDILLVNGLIEQLGKVQTPLNTEVVDLDGMIVSPGLCDMHVHFREPGFEYKETIASGVLSAIAGGFTAVCCMPNTNPAIDDASVVKTVIERGRAASGGIIDVYPIGAVTKKREGKELSPMLELAREGAVGFSDDGSPVNDAGMMRLALEYSSMTGLPVIQHAEERSLAAGGVMHEGTMSTKLGMPGIPSVAEETMIGRDIQLLRYCGGKYHVAHISTRGAVALVRAAHRDGLPVTCEVTPHHFTLTDEAVAHYDTNTKMNPPLRTADDVEAMIEGLRDGTIGVIATDHAPHSFDEKEVEFQYAPFGIVGLETALGLAVKALIEPNHLTWPDLIAKLSVNPRAILSLPPARIAEGETANLTIIDPDVEWTVDPALFQSKSKNTPFGGWKLKGKAVGIINHGLMILPGS